MPLLVFALLILSFAPSPAAAQAQAFAGYSADGSVDSDNAAHPFVLPGQSTEVNESLEDLARHIEKARWELAFKSLDKVLESGSQGLVARADGVMVPMDVMVRQMLAGLPPAGKQAYQLFHDAQAKALLADAVGEQEIEKLNQILSRYVITSVGDVAADRLGDIYFERGDIRRAAECWKLVLDARPDSAIPRALLLVKSGIASARAGRLAALRETLRQLRERHAGAEVVLGGRAVNAAEHLEHLEQSLSAVDPATRTSDAIGDVALPEATDPLWKFQFFSSSDIEALKNAGNNWGWQQMPVQDMVPPSARDAKRLYVNLLGYFFALDLETGKLLWRSGKFHEATKNLNQGPYFSVERYSLAAADDRLWAVARPTDQIGHHGAQFHVLCLNAADGAEIWNSQKINDLKKWNMTGTPVAAGERVYVAASENNQGTNLHLLALAAADGSLEWSAQIGTRQVDQNQVYYRKTPQPMLLADDETVLVETHDGALAMLDAESGKLQWGVAYESEQLDTQHYYNQPQAMHTAGAPLLRDGVLYFKGMLSDRVYAIDPAGPQLLWKRPVSQAAMIAGLDQQRLYLGGEELTAIDLETQRLAWSNKLPMGTSWVRPVLTRNHLYQFTPRGIYEIDKQTGDLVKLFRGDDLESMGGVILVTPSALVTVSNLSVTAYPLERAAQAETAQAAARE